jgi:SNF2 family DNA or RNA helicase
MSYDPAFSTDEEQTYVISPFSLPISSGFLSSSSHNIDNIRKESMEQWDNYPRIEQPTDLRIKLFPHQLVTVYNMEKLERLRKIKKTDDTFFMTDFGILGDIPGYGKSFSVVSLILRDKMMWDISKRNEKTDIYTYNSCLKVVEKTMKTRVRANLLVVSPTLVEQWKEYFSFVKEGALSLKEVSSKKDLEDLNPNEWDVVLCSSNRYNELISTVGSHRVWKRFIFDEAGSTHITSMRSIQAGFVWFITATYEQLMRCGGTGTHYMRCFFNNIDYNILPYFVIRNNIDFVKHSFRMPDVLHETHLCLNPRVLNILSNYIDQESRIMISAGDIKGALVRLGGGMTTTDSNLFEIVAKKQREKLANARYYVEFWKNRSSGSKEVETWEKRVADIEKNISELEEKYKNVLKDDCTICYGEIKEPILLPCCQNVFCGGCIMKWMETTKSCPMCRSDINIKEIVYIRTDSKTDMDDEKKDLSSPQKPKSKPQTVLDIVSQPNKKYLIFSMYDESFSTIRRELEEHKLDYVEISGSKPTRDAKLRRFKEGKVNIVFLNSRFNGAGINLEMATDIILYHEMPADIEEQVIGRALRIGREGDLLIHHLCLE